MSTKKHHLTDKNKVVDVMVYNDSDQLMFHTTPPGKKSAPITDIVGGVERELALVMQLAQDDCYALRARLGAPSAAEKREHIGFVSGHLDLSSGVLLSGESSIGVPASRYRVEVYSFIQHSMGRWQWKKASDRKEKLATFWRRTRSKQKFPDWLRWDCSCNPNDDPGHEKEWRGLTRIDDPTCAYVDFLVCLLSPSTKKSTSKVNRSGIAQWEIRCPEQCPKGIEAPGLPPYGEEFD